MCRTLFNDLLVALFELADIRGGFPFVSFLALMAVEWSKRACSLASHPRLAPSHYRCQPCIDCSFVGWGRSLSSELGSFIHLRLTRDGGAYIIAATVSAFLNSVLRAKIGRDDDALWVGNIAVTVSGHASINYPM